MDYKGVELELVKGLCENCYFFKMDCKKIKGFDCTDSLKIWVKKDKTDD